MTGNLKAFAGVGADGAHKLDHYASFLRTVGSDMFGYSGVLWLARIGLLVALVLHVVTIAQLQLRNRAARPVEYTKVKYRSSSVAARSMFLGGIIILVFVVFHLAHLTFGVVTPNSFEHGHVYENVYMAFSNPVFVGVYLIAMVFIGLHLFHGLWSLCQTLGIDRPDRNASLRLIAKSLALVIALGFMAVPVAVYSGLLDSPPSTYLEL
jgi:succinate dehydrogenase / fumarate reductase cytochrome b subunit